MLFGQLIRILLFALSADGGLRRRRGQADAPRSAAALRQAEGDGEEQEASRIARSSGVQPGIFLLFSNSIKLIESR